MGRRLVMTVTFLASMCLARDSVRSRPICMITRTSHIPSCTNDHRTAVLCAVRHSFRGVQRLESCVNENNEQI